MGDQISEFNAGVVVALNIANLFNECSAAFLRNDIRRLYILLDRLGVILSPYMKTPQVKKVNELRGLLQGDMMEIWRAFKPSDPLTLVMTDGFYDHSRELEECLRVVWKDSGLMARHGMSDSDDFE